MRRTISTFPPFFGRESRLGPHAGLIITAGLVLVIANLVDLSAIASVGSAIALAVFMLVAIAGYCRRHDTGAQTLIVLAAIGACAIVLVLFAIDTARNEPETFAAIVVIGLFSVVIDYLWKRRRDARAGGGPIPPGTDELPASSG